MYMYRRSGNFVVKNLIINNDVLRTFVYAMKIRLPCMRKLFKRNILPAKISQSSVYINVYALFTQEPYEYKYM